MRELKHACHTNCANCLLKLERWEAAVAECDVVLGHGPNRKALFRRAQALEKLDQDEEARAGFQQALKMEEDATVRACLVALEARMGVDDEPDAASEAAPAAAARGADDAASGHAGDAGWPDGMPDPVRWRRCSTRSRRSRWRSRRRCSRTWTRRSSRRWRRSSGGMDPSMMKGMAVRDAPRSASAQFLRRNLRRNSLTRRPTHLASQGMMKNMDPQMMKNMTRMAQQMGGVPGMGGGGGGGGGGAGPSGAGGMPDMANMDMSNAAEMMGKMNPDMMKAGMEMMKGMVRRYRAIRRNFRRNSAHCSGNSAQML